MRKYVNELGHVRWQPGLPDGRHLYHRWILGISRSAPEWTRPENAGQGHSKDLRRFKWSARFAERRQLRREKRWAWSSDGEDAE